MTIAPPAQYDHPPPMMVIEQVLPRSEVQRICHYLTTKWNGPQPSDRTWNGCSGVSKDDGKCYIWTVDDALTRRHERAHCNGWRHE